MSLCTPEEFLERVGAENQRALAILVHRKLMQDVFPGKEDGFFIHSNLFENAFITPKIAESF